MKINNFDKVEKKYYEISNIYFKIFCNFINGYWKLKDIRVIFFEIVL